MTKRRREPVFVEHAPVIQHRRKRGARRVPYPYRFKIDGGWLFVLFLAAGGFVFPLLWLVAGLHRADALSGCGCVSGFP